MARGGAGAFSERSVYARLKSAGASPQRKLARERLLITYIIGSCEGGNGMPGKRSLSPQQLLEIAYEYQSVGRSCADIALDYEVTPNTIRLSLRDLGITLRGSAGSGSTEYAGRSPVGRSPIA